MTTTEIICTAVATILGGNGLLTWWLQTRLEHRLRKEMVEHEAHLKAINIKLTRTFDTQAEIIATAYKKLVAVLRDAKAYLIFGGGDRTNKDIGDRMEDFQTLVKECLDYVEDNKIYFPRKNSDHLFALTTAIQHLVLQSDTLEDYRQFVQKDNGDETKLKELKESKMKLQNYINEVLRLLEGGFQELLGFPDTYTKSEVELFTEQLAGKITKP